MVVYDYMIKIQWYYQDTGLNIKENIHDLFVFPS